jgi:glyoxylase-like metal-dependent hydrolase (beta-lactamase superfamily II)
LSAKGGKLAAAVALVGALVTALVAGVLRPCPLFGPCPPATPSLPSLEPIWTGQSFAYLLGPADAADPNPSFVLIDAGSDARAGAIAQALARRGRTLADVGAVLLTHGHGHHTAGLQSLGHAPVYGSFLDGALSLGDRGPHNLWMRLSMRLSPRLRHALALRPLYAGQRLELLGHTLTVVALPGHTPGSVAFEVLGGLVAGDAVWGPSLCHPALAPYPTWVADAPQLASAVLARLGAQPLQFIADGHTGITIRRHCGETPPPP